MKKEKERRSLISYRLIEEVRSGTKYLLDRQYSTERNVVGFVSPLVKMKYRKVPREVKEVLLVCW